MNSSKSTTLSLEMVAHLMQKRKVREQKSSEENCNDTEELRRKKLKIELTDVPTMHTTAQRHLVQPCGKIVRDLFSSRLTPTSAGGSYV